MPVLDYEACWYSLKAEIQGKRSHGAKDLAEAMARIEVENRLDESQAGFDDRPPARLKAVITPPSDDGAESFAAPA